MGLVRTGRPDSGVGTHVHGRFVFIIILLYVQSQRLQYDCIQYNHLRLYSSISDLTWELADSTPL